MGTTFQKQFGREGKFVGTLTAFDPVEDLYEIVYDDADVEELTWTDLHKLLRASGDTVTAPAAAPPVGREESIPMALTVAIQLQKDLMSKVAFDPVKAASQVAFDPVKDFDVKEAKVDNGKGVTSGYSSDASSDAHSVSVDGERIVAAKTRGKKKHVSPEESTVKTQAPRQSSWTKVSMSCEAVHFSRTLPGTRVLQYLPALRPRTPQQTSATLRVLYVTVVWMSATGKRQTTFRGQHPCHQHMGHSRNVSPQLGRVEWMYGYTLDVFAKDFIANTRAGMQTFCHIPMLAIIVGLH
jgi:hypothetical protein